MNKGPFYQLVELAKNLDERVTVLSEIERKKKSDQVITFKLMKEHFCVPLVDVIEVMAELSIIDVPFTADWLLGLSNVRGNLIPIIDLSKFFGLDSSRQSILSRTLIIRHNSVSIGLLLQKSISLQPLLAIEPIGALPEGLPSEYISGIMRANESYWMLQLKSLWVDDKLNQMVNLRQVKEIQS